MWIIAKALRINGQLRITPIRVIDQHQTQLGVVALKDAMDLARDAGLDLVEVSPMEKPPVCRIMDYGKFKYERKKRQKQASGGHVILLKEIRIRPKTDVHDREIKMNRAKAFLEEGHKVQFTMLFRGRERFHRDRAIAIFDELLAEMGETIKIERRPAMEGRRMTMVVSPSKTAAASGSSKPVVSPKPKPKPKAPAPSSTPPAASAPSSPPPDVPASSSPLPEGSSPAPSSPASTGPAQPPGE